MRAIKPLMNDARSALVLFSGGQDSTTCLAWALERFAHVETVAFDYRQRHRIELDQRLIVLDQIRHRFPHWADRLGEDHFIDMGVLGQISETSLTRGMCETDFSGYPDCRDNTIKALQVTLNLGMDRAFVLHTPLMWLDKAETWGLANELGGPPLVDLVLEHTHTCYDSVRGARHDWGYGCGECPACALRKRGFIAWREGKTSL